MSSVDTDLLACFSDIFVIFPFMSVLGIELRAYPFELVRVLVPWVLMPNTLLFNVRKHGRITTREAAMIPI